jgi:hypothetical protein
MLLAMPLTTVCYYILVISGQILWLVLEPSLLDIFCVYLLDIKPLAQSISKLDKAGLTLERIGVSVRVHYVRVIFLVENLDVCD